jgi:hypothetical protein
LDSCGIAINTIWRCLRSIVYDLNGTGWCKLWKFQFRNDPLSLSPLSVTPKRRIGSNASGNGALCGRVKGHGNEPWTSWPLLKEVVARWFRLLRTWKARRLRRDNPPGHLISNFCSIHRSNPPPRQSTQGGTPVDTPPQMFGGTYRRSDFGSYGLGGSIFLAN